LQGLLGLRAAARVDGAAGPFALDTHSGQLSAQFLFGLVQRLSNGGQIGARLGDDLWRILTWKPAFQPMIPDIQQSRNAYHPPGVCCAAPGDRRDDFKTRKSTFQQRSDPWQQARCFWCRDDGAERAINIQQQAAWMLTERSLQGLRVLVGQTWRQGRMAC
jgi:hypothetical protein